jgi:hypothetical protein
MNKITLGLIAFVIILAVALPASLLSLPSQVSQEQQELDFTVIGKNDCLRFLDKNVSIAYIPFKTGANEKWNLTIDCLEMPTANAWTDLYIYRGYWNEGTDHKCMSQDLYSIISQIDSTDYRVKANSTFTETFGGSTSQSYTFFFILPPNGPGTFHIKLNQVE